MIDHFNMHIQSVASFFLMRTMKESGTADILLVILESYYSRIQSIGIY